MKKTKLKPCPYCGNPNPQLHRIAPNAWEAYCGIYVCDMPYSFICASEEDAVETWNNHAEEKNESN